MIVYRALIPLTVINGILIGYFSVRISIERDYVSLVILALANMIPLGAWISRYSKNLLFDLLLYYFAVMTDVITMLIIDNRQSISSINYAGYLLALVGFILLRASHSTN